MINAPAPTLTASNAEEPFREAPTTGSNWFSLPHVLGFAVLWTLAHIAGAWLWFPELLTGAQVDPDGYMRLVRVRDLLQNGAWYDTVIARSNWPYGETHHWTRPLDIVIIALILPLRLVMSQADALAAAGAVVSPLLHLLLCITAVWVITPLVSGAERHLVMPAVFAQVAVLTYGSLGRADHHMLIFLLFTLALGAWIRVLLNPDDRRSAFLAGAFSGAGIWVGPETLLPLALLFLSGAIAWILNGARYHAPNIRLCTGLAVAIAAALIIERPPSALLTAEFDRISIAHLHLSLIALAFWFVAGARRPAISADGPPRLARVARALAGATAAAVILLVLHPRFFRGPWVGVDPAIIGVWLSRVAELQPAFPRARADVGRFISMLGSALLLIPFISVWWWREHDAKRRLAWLLLLTSLLVYVPLAAAQLRFSPYAGIIAAIAGIELLRRAFARLQTVSGLRLSVVRVALILGVLLWPIVAGETLNAVQRDRLNGAVPAASTDCDVTDAALRLNDTVLSGSQPHTIAAFIDFGPELLYRTRHRVLAGPYHRNRAGILAAHTLLTTRADAQARAIVRRRGVDLILLCPSRDGEYFRGTTARTLYARLVRGEAPTWIREVPFDSPGFRLFVVADTEEAE